GCTIDAAGDHRIAMAAAIAATVASSPVTIHGAECVSKSYPTFCAESRKSFQREFIILLFLRAVPFSNADCRNNEKQQEEKTDRPEHFYSSGTSIICPIFSCFVRR
ncbi:MAG: hypothetical protein II341_05605, partial [Oscillospiraceae bacterium]|nr:hypothetical protein [Oscillospiraceae bacterium]